MIENFEKLEFTRKVDVLVAVHLMEWKDVVISDIESSSVVWGPADPKWLCKGVDRFHGQGCIPLYSTVLTAAWEIVRKCDYVYLFRSNDFQDGRWECKLMDKQSVVNDDGRTNKYCEWALAETEMLAICYAGLNVVRFDVKKFLQEEKKI